MIYMIDMNVPEHRGATRFGVAAPGAPHDDPDQARRQPDSGILGICGFDGGWDSWGLRILWW